MSTRLRMLVIAVMTIGACGSVRPDELALDAGADSDRAGRDAHNSAVGLRTDASQWPTDAGRVQIRQDTDFDAETGADEDAGIDGLAADIAFDCRETLRCDPSVGASLPGCIRAVTESLSKSPEGRARFVEIIGPCRTQRGCEYVSCVQKGAPSGP